MAYAAVVSLKQTIRRLQQSCDVSQEFVKFMYDKTYCLIYILSSLDRSSSSRERMINALYGQIKEVACKFEDALESHVSNKFVSLSESHQSSISLDLHELKQDIDLFSETVNKLKKYYMKELSDDDEDDDDDDRDIDVDDDDDVSPRIFGSCGNKSKMVGFSDELSKFRQLLIDLSCGVHVKCVPLVGMAGIGKTTLANEILKDPLIERHFDRRAFVTIGPKYQPKEIMQAILAHLNPRVPTDGNAKLSSLKRMIYQSLKSKRYLIVLDDLWHEQAWRDLRRLFPDNKNGSRFLVTTRLERIAEYVAKLSSANKIRFLNKEESWCLLRDKVFGEMSCPPQLEKVGENIAESCEGLPLAIITVADLLSKADKTRHYWNKVATKENSVFMDAYDQMSKVLFPSYDYLPQKLKAYFLYMGIFPQNYEIPFSKLSMLWCAEGLFESSHHNDKRFTLVCLKELVSASLVMICKQSSSFGIKTCCLHSVIWHLCNKEADKDKFFHVLNSCADRSEEGIENQRRLCIRNNILFGIKDVNNLSASNSTIRSLILCSDPTDQYPIITMSFGHLRLLRKLVALTIGFYEFPIEILNLVHLRYLALTFYNGNLPASISKLWNLQFLIVRRYSKAPSYLPIEIWDMKQLEHVQIMGINLPDPNYGAFLPNLFTLLDVSALSCTKDVLERLNNLMKLGIRIELAPDVVEPLSFIDHISNFYTLKSLKCVVVNPKLRIEVVGPPPRLSSFSSYLHKLSLSGFGYPWEDMSVIASLPYLRVLKLRCYAFRGPKWAAYELKFLQLEFLLIEDTDLVHWTATGDSFPLLRRLNLTQCSKLQEIPVAFGKTLEKIELVECNPLAVICAQQMEKETLLLDVHILSS